MDNAVRDLVVPLLKLHEADRQYPYDDANGRMVKRGSVVSGNITIGVGRNLNAKGLSEEERAFLLDNDIRDAESDAIFLLGEKVYRGLSPVRKAVLIDMAFNMGRERLAGFTDTLTCIRQGIFQQAAICMKESKWARQVGQRAITLADMMRNG